MSSIKIGFKIWSRNAEKTLEQILSNFQISASNVQLILLTKFYQENKIFTISEVF